MLEAMASRSQPALPFPTGPSGPRGAGGKSATLTIPEAAKLLGVGRNLAYEIAAREGELAGVPVIRVGRRLVVPHARLLSVLGLIDRLTSEDPEA
jgi:Helix-turn-helix domain